MHRVLRRGGRLAVAVCDSLDRSPGTVRFGSIDALVSTERACVWTLGGLLDDTRFGRLLSEARRVFQPFVEADGAVAFEMPALLVTACRR